MLDQWLFDLFLQMRVPIEVFIIIVILSGGIYLIIVLVKEGPNPPAPEKDPESAAMHELIVAMLEGRNSDLESIFSRHSIDANKAKTFEALAAITLDVIFSEEHSHKTIDQKITLLENSSVPNGIAKRLLVLAMNACTEVAGRREGAIGQKESEWSHLL